MATPSDMHSWKTDIRLKTLRYIDPSALSFFTWLLNPFVIRQRCQHPRLPLVCLWISVHVYVCICLCVYACMYVSVFVCGCVCIWMYVCMCMCIYGCMYVYVYVCVYVCVRVCVWSYIKHSPLWCKWKWHDHTLRSISYTKCLIPRNFRINSHPLET